MKISVLAAQFPVSLSILENLKNILDMLDNARSGDIVLFPEGAVSGYSHDLDFIKDINPGEFKSAVDQLRNQVQKKGVHLWVGTCILEGTQWFNAALGFTPNGGAYQYRKINLANHERDLITPGSDLPVFKLEMPGGLVKVGVQICREIRYPEQWGWLARQGAHVILHLNNAVNDARYLPVWRSHLISHAASNQRYVISANNASPEQISPTIAVSPEGWVLDEIISDCCAFIRVEVDLSRVSGRYLDQCRKDVVTINIPSNKERRKIVRSMKLGKLQKDLGELRGNAALYDEPNLTARTEALEFINMIEDLHRVRSSDRDLLDLYRHAMALRRRLEHINTRLFAKLRGRIKLGEYTPIQLREHFNPYTDYKPHNPGQPHYGYEDLDGLIAGVFLTQPAPEETLERQPGMIRYQPTPASVILELIDQVNFSADDVFYDLGSGLGQVVDLVNILTGVRCVGVEYQPAYCSYAAQMAEELGLRDVNFINTDARYVEYGEGTVFFMFNPFGGRIFDAVMGKLRTQAQKRTITICSYGSCTEPISELPWLDIFHSDTIHDFKLAVFRSKSFQSNSS
jgi:predicted amidohydrolase